MDTKIIGYSLLFVGIITILYAGISVYLVFTGQANAINPFETQGVALDLGTLMGAGSLPGLENAEFSQEIIDASSLNMMLNFTAHILLMGFLASIGYKLAMIGTNLTRPIKVRLNAEDKSTQTKSPNLKD